MLMVPSPSQTVLPMSTMKTTWTMTIFGKTSFRSKMNLPATRMVKRLIHLQILQLALSPRLLLPVLPLPPVKIRSTLSSTILTVVSLALSVAIRHIINFSLETLNPASPLHSQAHIAMAPFEVSNVEDSKLPTLQSLLCASGSLAGRPFLLIQVLLHI